MADFSAALKKTLVFEGGYLNDPADPGGETNYGITVGEARLNGYIGSMQDIPMDIVETIYRKKYWDVLGLDLMANQALAEELFDSAVNCGPSWPTTWLRWALSLLNNQGTRWPDPGVYATNADLVDLANQASTNPTWINRIRKAVVLQRGCRYLEITKQNPKLEKWLGGWLDNRVNL